VQKSGADDPAIQLIPYASVFSKERNAKDETAATGSPQEITKMLNLAGFSKDPT
jgi:hypothetical protein